MLDKALQRELHSQTGVTLLAEDGTFNDYSAITPRFFSLVTDALAAFYCAALQYMCEAHGIRVADVATFQVFYCRACRCTRHPIMSLHAPSNLAMLYFDFDRAISEIKRHIHVATRHKVRQTGKIRARLCQQTAGLEMALLALRACIT